MEPRSKFKFFNEIFSKLVLRKFKKHLRQDEVKSYLDLIEYGNEEISGNENYWNESSLKISAIEQVNLLKI